MKQPNQSEDGTVSKYCRFKLEPENIENEPQKLDEYIKELLSDNKKLSTLNQEKTLKGTQESSINFRPLDQTLEYHGSRTGSTSR